MAFKFAGKWAYNSFISSPESEGEQCTLTQWLHNYTLQVSTDDGGNVSGYLSSGITVLTVLGTVEQSTIKLTAQGIGAIYQITAQVAAGAQEITGKMTCVAGDLTGQPDGTTGVCFVINAQSSNKLLIDDSGERPIAYATHFDDVEEVLIRDDVFFVTYEKAMREITNGENFFLGMQNSPEYQQDVANMRSVVRRNDLTAINDFVDKLAQSIVANADGEIELVSVLARSVPTQWFMDYFGCKNDDVAEMAKWSCELFRYIFVPNNSDEFNQQALASAKSTREFLDKIIAQRKADGGDYDDILSRLLALQKANVPRMSDLNIRNNFIGLFTGAVMTTGSAVTNIIDQLLRRPDELAAAQQAARDDNDELLAKYVFEALRFNPISIGLTRLCSQDYTVAKGTERETLIKAGTVVVTGTLRAMFDPQQISEPELFKIDRPDYHYLYFGYGLHKCFGQYINNVQIPVIAKALLKRADLRRAPGDAGQIKLEVGFPVSLTVLFNKNKKSIKEENNMSGSFNPSQHALNLVLRVKQPIVENAAGLRAVLGQLTPEGLNNVGTVHFGRFLFMNDDTLFLIFTEYDGTFEAYINDFINETGKAFNALLSFLDVPDGVTPVEEHRKAFYELIKANDLKEEVFYCAYPTKSVLQINSES